MVNENQIKELKKFFLFFTSFFSYFFRCWQVQEEKKFISFSDEFDDRR
jgi:hypothetical protein